MITEIIVGEAIGGTTNVYITNKLNETGEAGKRVSIGRGNKRGVSRVCDTKGDHKNRLEGCSNREPMKEGKFNKTGRANNSTQSNSREAMKAGEGSSKTGWKVG